MTFWWHFEIWLLEADLIKQQDDLSIFTSDKYLQLILLTFRTCDHNPLVRVPIGLLHRPIGGHHLSQEVNVPKKVIIELWDPIFRCSHPIVSLSVSTLLSRFSYGRVGMCWRRPSNASLILWKLTQDYEIILMKYVNNWFKLLNFCPFLRVPQS